jgi:uncharacterized protein YfdQ (DUF2303 family)
MSLSTRTFEPQTGRIVRTENDAVIEVAINSTEPNELTPGKIYSLVTSTGNVETIDLSGDQYRDAPKRKTGTVTDIDRALIEAVIDAHGSVVAGWRNHRIRYELRLTRPWETWAAVSGRMLGQVEFAELLEDNLATVARPDAAELLELAQTFTAKTEVNFKSGALLASGARELMYSEDVEASGGRSRKLTIPKEIVLGLSPFEGSSPVAVTARFRYRINDGNLRLGVVLDGMDEHLAAAFNEVVEDLAERIGHDIMHGRPA